MARKYAARSSNRARPSSRVGRGGGRGASSAPRRAPKRRAAASSRSAPRAKAQTIRLEIVHAPADPVARPAALLNGVTVEPDVKKSTF